MRVYYPGSKDIPAGLAPNGKPWPTLRLEQLEAIYRLKRVVLEGAKPPGAPEAYHSALVGAGMGSGKAQPLDSLVLTPNGFVRMGDIQLGAEVVTPGGDTAKVSGIFPQGERETYRVTLVDGREILADGGHLWTVLDRNRRRSGPVVISTKEMLSRGIVSRNGNRRFEIQRITAADLGEWRSSLSPWLIGALLGNGGLKNCVMFSSADQDTIRRVASSLPSGVSLEHRGNYDYAITIGRKGGKNPVTTELRRLGIHGHGSWTKFIPEELKHSSVQDRLALVHGLLDTDGSPVKAGFEYSSASKRLADDFVWLVRSLGGRATQSVKTVDGKEYQRVYGRLPSGMEPFLSERKAAKMIHATKYELNGLAIRSIEYIGDMETQCIMVDHSDHEYVTDGFTRTHNTVCSVEVIMHTKPERCLIVGVRDAYDQWAEAVRDQQPDDPTSPEPKRELLRIDNTKTGKRHLAMLLAGAPGLFYAGLEMLRAQDWEDVSETIVTDPEINKMLGGILPESVTIKSRKQLKTYENMPVVDLLISDESHKHANQKSAAIKTVRTIKAKAKIALSGTFFGNKFENAWSVAVWLWGYGVANRKGVWEAKYVLKEPVMSRDGRTVLRTRYGAPLMKLVGEKNPGEFVESLPCYIFMPTPIGPPPPPEVLKIDLHPEQLRQYREMEEQSLTFIPTVSGNREPLIADLPLTQRTRLRTAALGGMTLVPGDEDKDKADSITFEPGTPSSTLAALYGVLHRPDWEGEKALILTHSKEFANETARRIGSKYTVALKTGGTASKAWTEQKRRFRLPKEHPDSIQYVIGVISAIGTATDGLQDNCSKVVWLSRDDNTSNNLQASNRIWRSGVDMEKYQAVEIVQRGTVAESVLTKDRSLSGSISGSVSGIV